MIEGLWSISFSTVDQPQEDVGAGVVVFETLRIFGGDSVYFYTGNYSIVKENQIKASVSVNHYYGPPLSIFGPLAKCTIIIDGSIAADEFYVQGYVKENPLLKLIVKFVKRAELP